jgi:hypothetical protein
MGNVPSGLLLVGDFVGVEQMSYGKNHATKAGEPIEGFYRVEVELFAGQRFPLSAAFSEVDGSTGMPSPVFDQIEQAAIVAGDRVAIHVAVDSVDKSYGPRLRALGVCKIDGEQAEGTAAAWPSAASA